MEEFDDIDDEVSSVLHCMAAAEAMFFDEDPGLHSQSTSSHAVRQTRQAKRDYGDRESEWKIFMDEARGEADDSKIGRTFRFRFGLQLSLFRDIYNEVLHLKWFGEADKKRDATGKEGHSLEVKLLGTLNILTKATVLDQEAVLTHFCINPP